MADTIRSRADILSLLADNTTGDISPQDLRDAIVSLHGVRGEMYVADNSGGAAQSIGTSYEKITQWDTAGESSGTTVDETTNNRITVGTARVVKVDVSLSFEGGAAGVYSFTVYKDGVRETQLTADQECDGTAGNFFSVSISGFVDCAVNEYLEVWCLAPGAATDVLVVQGNFSVLGVA